MALLLLHHKTIEKRIKNARKWGFSIAKFEKIFSFRGRCLLTPTKLFETFGLYKKIIRYLFVNTFYNFSILITFFLNYCPKCTHL